MGFWDCVAIVAGLIALDSIIVNVLNVVSRWQANECETRIKIAEIECSRGPNSVGPTVDFQPDNSATTTGVNADRNVILCKPDSGPF